MFLNELCQSLSRYEQKTGFDDVFADVINKYYLAYYDHRFTDSQLELLSAPSVFLDNWLDFEPAALGMVAKRYTNGMFEDIKLLKSKAAIESRIDKLELELDSLIDYLGNIDSEVAQDNVKSMLEMKGFIAIAKTKKID